MRNIIYPKPYFALLMLLLIAGRPGLLQAADGGSIFDLLYQADATALAEAKPVILRLPMDSIYAKSNHKQRAVISFTDDATGREFRRPLHVEVRGKFRRHLCTFPPLRLNFSKQLLRAEGLSAHDKLKLVTPCFSDAESQQLILKEYLAYKMFSRLSPASFRVQLLEITYRDLNNQHPDQTVYAFVLEDVDELAARLGGVEMENGRGLAPDRFDRRAETTQALFSYFIGNLDWNLSMGRNLKMIALDNGQVIPVPYDFDFSGFVDAPYRRLNSAVGQEYGSQRIYLGFSCSDDILNEVYVHFSEQRKELLKAVRSFHLLSLEGRYQAVEYLNSFYTDFRGLQKKRGADTTKSLYVYLRAGQLELLPPGGRAEDYGISK